MPKPPNQEKHQTDVPVRVVAEQAVRPNQPPVELSVTADKPPPPLATKAKLRRPSRSRPMMDEVQRRKIMWVIVAVSSVIIVVGWIWLMPKQWRGGDQGLFADLTKIFKSLKSPDQVPTADPEIRDLTNQVFPQFGN